MTHSIPETLESFLIAPFGRAGLAKSARAGDAVTVEMYSQAATKRRIVIAARCVHSEHDGGYLCVSCAQPLANRFQLDLHVERGVHYAAQWCTRCQQWETCPETPAGPLAIRGRFV